MNFREKYLQEMQFTEWMVSGQDVMATNDKRNRFSTARLSTWMFGSKSRANTTFNASDNPMQVEAHTHAYLRHFF
jgi:hypothetical protein